MTGLNCVVVGVDGSSQSNFALDWAVDHLSGQGSLHVVHAVATASKLPRPGAWSDNFSAQGDASALLAGTWTEEASGQFPMLERHLVEDDPADALLGVARDHRAEAVVVGPHGDANSRVLGSVTRKLLHHSELPTLVVNERSPNKTRDRRRPVVACIGYGEASDRAAQWAADFAASADLQLMLIHVVSYRPIFPVDSPGDVLASYLGWDFGRDWAQIELDQIATELQDRQPGLSIVTEVDVGFAVRGIRTVGADAELVVLGKRHSNAAARATISPRISRLLTRAPTTIAVVPSCADR